MIYMIGIYIVSYFFMWGDNEVSVLEELVDGIDFCIDKFVWNFFCKKKKVMEVVIMFIMIMSGIFVDMTLEIGRLVVFVVNFGVFWIMKLLDKVMLCLNKFIVIVILIGGRLTCIVIGNKIVFIKVIVGEG